MTEKWVRLSYLIGQEDTQAAEEFKIPAPKLHALSRIEDGMMSNVGQIELGFHAGTHMDVPRHFDPEGLTMEAFEIEDFIFQAPLLVEVEKKPGEEIGAEDLRPHEAALKNCDLLLIRTGFSKYRLVDFKKYVEDYPGLSPEAAAYLAGIGSLKGIGIDLIGIENILRGRRRGFTVHKSLLCRGMKFIIIEDMNLEPLVNRKIECVHAVPLMIRHAEASPVTVMAKIEWP